MPTYTFHHYSAAGEAVGITFRDFEADPEALAHALTLLRIHDIACVEVCDLRREVGHVRQHATPPTSAEASGFTGRGRRRR